MSARRIKMTRNQASQPQRRQDVVTRKWDERRTREIHRREREITTYLADDENFPSFKIQLAKVGLELRDIPGDGNCLFRALGDQYEGHVRNHFKHRQDTVKYMIEHKEDFEPFLDETVSFEKHILSLKSLGTYAGNDAIVAFARLHQVNIIIHQLSAPFLLIQGTTKQQANVRQLHLAYHNGDHYSSVRKLNDNTESPTNICIKVNNDSPQREVEMNGHVAGDGVVRAVRDAHRLAEEVMNATGCQDEQAVLDALTECYYDVDETIAYILQTMETCGISQDDTTSLASQMTSTDSGLGSENGSKVYTSPVVDEHHNGKHVKGHFRESSFGGSSGYGSVSSQNGGARPKLPVTMSKKAQEKISAKQKKEMKKLEKKKRAEERHRQRLQGIAPPVLDHCDHPALGTSLTVITKDLQMTKI